jgi:hypothetical protein
MNKNVNPGSCDWRKARARLYVTARKHHFAKGAVGLLLFDVLNASDNDQELVTQCRLLQVYRTPVCDLSLVLL